MSERTVWGLAGLLLAAGLAVLAWLLAKRADPERNFYGLDGATHGRYAAVFAALALACGAALFMPVPVLYVLLGGLVPAAVFYGASFARGATDEDEP